MDPANKDKYTVKVGVQAGDIPSDEATDPHIGPLRKLLHEICRGPYSPEVDEFYLTLRIDGDIDHWEKEGCDCMRRSRKGRYISIDIYVPRTRWEGVSGIEIRRYLASCVESAFQQMIGKLQRDKTPIEGDALLRDWAAVKERYLSQDEAVATY
jgi:hypothetical protein